MRTHPLRRKARQLNSQIGDADATNAHTDPGHSGGLRLGFGDRLWTILVVLTLTQSQSVPLLAQDSKFAVTDLSQVDADYYDQGEYVGPIRLDGCQCEVGLQVVARGHGKFDALLYRGGLPGNGYDYSPRRKLSGSRLEDKVHLVGQGMIVILQTGYAAVVKNSGGERMGFLQPIKRHSATIDAKPPENAIVLFDGQNIDKLQNAKITSDGLLEVGCETKETYRNFTLHAEFRTPYMPHARGQDRANSGFYLQKRYEVQVLDSFGLDPLNNDCGALYKFKAPDLNMSFPPLRWQTYDVSFTAPTFASNGCKICKGRITVRHNGVLIHNQVELENKTGGGSPEGPNPMPILFQNHGNPVNFRNIWLVDNGADCACQTSCCAADSCPQRVKTGIRRWHLLKR